MSHFSWIACDSNSVNWDDWCDVCCDSSDLAMDPRFLQALDESMADVASTKYLIGYDSNKQPVACVCVSRFLVDGSILMEKPWQHTSVRLIRKIFPRYLMFHILFCGLPVSIGSSNLRFAEGVDKKLVVDSLLQEIDRLAAELRSLVIVWKEFDEVECLPLQSLIQQGYLQGDSLPMNTFDCNYQNFDHFCEALRSHYRYKIKRSRKKFEKAGLRVEHITDPKRIEKLYTPEVHQLYLAVLDQAENRLETLPREFFINLVHNLPEEISFTSVFQDGEIVAFAWGLRMGEKYRNIFVGFNYDLNPRTDLYFNMMMSDLNYGMQTGAKHVYMGQSANEFKSRLGCYQQPLSVFMKTRSKALNWLARIASGLLFPPHKGAPVRDLFKDESQPAKSPATATVCDH